ncbi:MAG TPA: DEAD/DEAH box helicase [Mycobacterium sp.]|nr:DEAD/DEAH box helicase [Mycobacterium sp.]
MLSPDTQALRGWQRRALVRYLRAKPRDFLAVATPGAGKTTFALRIAAELLADGTVERVTVVVPTEHLKSQWALAAERVGIALDPKFSNSSAHTSPEYHGVVVTYAQVASHPTRHRVRTENYRTLVVFDEIHHDGDAKSWGDAIREAYSDATRRLALTGTPFRSDDSPIPFVTYEPDGAGRMRSHADHTYGYAEALADGVVRPVVFLAYSGEARWRDSAGEEHAARLGEPLTAGQTARAWRTALNPAGEWIPAVLQAANTRLDQLREGGMPDAGAMVIASDQTAARAYAAVLTKLTGKTPTVVLSDDPGSSARIAEYSAGTSPWLVAQRNHALGKPHRESEEEDEYVERRNSERNELDNGFESLGADAELDQVIFDGSSFGTATPAGSAEEADYLGIPGLLDAAQMRDLLRRRQDEQLSKRTASGEVPRPSTHGQLRELRRELNTLVSIAHHRTGKPHGWIHNELRRICGGPPIAAATTDQLKARIEAVRTLQA